MPRKNKPNKDRDRGITSIVAVVLLIAIAVIAGISIYFWTVGIATKQPTPEQPNSIIANPLPGGKVLIANLGQGNVNTSTLKTSDPNLVISCDKQVIAPGEQVLCTIKGTPGESRVAIYGSNTGSVSVEVASLGNIEENWTPITNCTVIDQPGNYYLANDITDSHNSTCVDIEANNVTFDCRGHKIDGVDSSNSFGIWVKRGNVIPVHINIKNCILSDWQGGLLLYRVADVYVSNLTATSNGAGIEVFYIQNSSFSQISSNNNTYEGMYVVGSTSVIPARNNVFENVTCTYNNYGILTDTVQNNTLTDIKLAHNWYEGLELYRHSSNNTFETLNSSYNGHDRWDYGYGSYQGRGGVRITDHSDNNLFKRTTILNNRAMGIFTTSDSTGNRFLDSTIANNSDWDVYLFSCSTVLQNVTVTENKPIYYFAEPVNLENKSGISELILCDADGSRLKNLTVGGYGNDGILSVYTDNSVFEKLNSSDNAWGLVLYDNSNNTVINNTFVNNAVAGLFLAERSSNNLIQDNVIAGYKSQDSGIFLSMYPTGNTIFNNYVRSSGGDVFRYWDITCTTCNNTWNSTVCGNWWSDYSPTCNDTNGDGICDDNYTIASGNVDYKPIAGNGSNWPYPGC